MKDYKLSGKDIERVVEVAEFYMDAGCSFETAAAMARKVVEMRSWQLKRLNRHERSGRCGGNADEALAELKEALEFLQNSR